MWQLVVSTMLILSYLGVISVGCIIAGVSALFDGSPLWFGVSGILLGVVGLFCTHYHLSLSISVYREQRNRK